MNCIAKNYYRVRRIRTSIALTPILAAATGATYGHADAIFDGAAPVRGRFRCLM